MKRSIVLVIVVLAATLAVWLGFRMTRQDPDSVAPVVMPQSPDLPPPTTTNTDAEEVFKRAFWRRPTADDRILHAERREWADEGGVDRWQWFIAVDPSQELGRYLDGNPFSLSDPAGKAAIPASPRPGWFPASADGYGVSQSRDGQMLILTQKESGRLFATSQGRGFAKPVEHTPQTPPLSHESANPGRLPSHPPPVPEE